MSQIDWSKAPEGATHYLVEQCSHLSKYWVKVEGLAFYYCRFGYEDGGFRPWLSDYERFLPSLIARPVAPSQAWSGDGLPPVGTVCDAIMPGSDFWRRVRVVYIGEPGSKTEALVFETHSSRPAWCDQFRPIRTPEQIAAEERERAINDLAAELGGHWSEEAVAPQRNLAAYLHDIGYRKVGGGAQ